MHAGVDEARELFARIATIHSPSGEEREMADAVIDFVRGVGLTAEEDDSAGRSGCAAGNLLVRVPACGAGTPIALCAHLDTVPAERSPVVIVDDGVLRSDGETILGADDKAAVAALLLLLRDLATAAPAAGVEVVFTVGEEVGLAGAKAFDVAGLLAAAVFVMDGEGPPGTVVTSGPTTRTVDARFRGVAAHAGIEPERGRSAVAAAARAVAAMRLGRLDDQTSANVGVIEGGDAVNVVPERCLVRAEARGRDEEKLARVVGGMVDAFSLGAAECGVDVAIDVREQYRGYGLDQDSFAVRTAVAAVTAAGLDLQLVESGAGSDANVFNQQGVPAVNLGVGFGRVHSPQEYIRLAHLEQTCRLVREIVAAAGETRG